MTIDDSTTKNTRLTDSNKFFSASRDFLGGLPAIFFAAYSRLSLDFRGGGGVAKFSRLAAG